MKERNFNLHHSPTSINSSPHAQLDCQKTPMGEPTVDRQQVTIFHNGQVFVTNMIELQARAMILLASRERQGRRGTSRLSNAALLVLLQSQIFGPPGVSIKNSLQRFLQKKIKRNQAASPYNNNHHL